MFSPNDNDDNDDEMKTAMTTERQLIRDETNGGRCSVVGLVPESIVQYLSSSSKGIMTDGHYCGIVHQNCIRIWKQRISTLSEPLDEQQGKEEEEGVIELVHPSFKEDTFHVGWTVHQNVLWVYVCPTKSGTLCVWTLPSSLDSFYNSSCNAHVLLPLYEQERITSLHVAFNKAVYLGTNQNSMWIAVPQSCPLELRARRLLNSLHQSSSLTSTLSSLFFTTTAATQPKLFSQDDVVKSFYIQESNNTIVTDYKKQKLNQGPSFVLAITKKGWTQVWKITNNDSSFKEQFLFAHDLKKHVTNNQSDDGNDVWNVSNATIDDQNTFLVAIQNITKGKVYILKCAFNTTEKTIRMFNAVSLTRFSKESIQSNKLSCAGLILQSSSNMAYSLWQQEQQQEQRIHPVTLTSIQWTKNGETKIQDYDLPPSILPSIVHNAMTKDIITDGCLFMSTSGVIANAEMIVRQQGEDTHQDSMEQLQLLTSHLSSAFQIHLRSSSSTININDLPQSILSCNSSSLLSQAILQVAKQQTMAMSSNGKNSQASTSSITLLQQIKDLLETHTSFINFCIHAGIYKKCNMVCKLALRDLGEIMYSIGCMCSYWQMEVEQQHQQEQQDEIQFKQKEIRHLITNHFNNAKIGDSQNVDTNIVLDFVDTFLGDLQNSIFQYLYEPKNGDDDYKDKNAWTVISGEKDLLSMNDDDDDEFSIIHKFAMDQFTSLLGIVIHFTIEYRNDKSEKLYDVIILNESEDSHNGWGDLIQSAPWTSQSKLLELIQLQLQYVMDQNSNEENFEMYADVIPTFASTLLGGYLDIPSKQRDEKLYHEAKRIAISAVQSTQNKRVALLQESLEFQLSLQHAYFEGIVSLAHPFTFSNDMKSDNVDLFTILSDINRTDKDNGKMDNPYYSLLKNRTDFETGYPFTNYVLWWYSNRGLYGNVLQLGKCCPEILQEFLKSDAGLSNFLWIHQMRERSYSDATSSLIKLISNGFTAFGTKFEDENKRCSLQDRKLVLSLAKLSATAAASTLAKETKLEDREQTAIIDDNLQLVHAQSIIMDLLQRKEMCDTSKTDYAMDADELLSFSLENIAKLSDVDDKVTVAIVGISIAKVSSEKALNAARVWRLVIEQDMNTWKLLLQNDLEMSDKQRARYVSDTVLYSLAKEYYLTPTSSSNSLDNVVCFKHNPLVSQKAVEAIEVNYPGLRDLLKSVVHMSGSELITQ